MSDLDDIRQTIYDWIKEQSQQIDTMRQEVTEYKKTVNTAISLLSKELLEFISRDVAERKQRQRRQDYKDIAIGCIGVLTLLLGCSIISLLLYMTYSR